MAKFRGEGYRVAIVEKFNPHARIRQDLFGMFDLLAIKSGETLGVQVTSSSNISTRIHKIEDSEVLADVRDASWSIHVHGWRKDKSGKWVCRVVDLLQPRNMPSNTPVQPP